MARSIEAESALRSASEVVETIAGGGAGEGAAVAGAKRIDGTDRRIELAAALVAARQGNFLALLEMGLLVRPEVAGAVKSQRLDPRLREILAGHALDLDRLGEGVAAADRGPALE